MTKTLATTAATHESTFLSRFVSHWREPGFLFVTSLFVFSSWRLLRPVSGPWPLAAGVLIAAFLAAFFVLFTRYSDEQRRVELKSAWHGSFVAIWASSLVAAYFVVPFGGSLPFFLGMTTLPVLLILGLFGRLQGFLGNVIALGLLAMTVLVANVVPHGALLAEAVVRFSEPGLTQAVESGETDGLTQGVSYFMWNGYLVDGASGLAHDPAHLLDDPDKADEIWQSLTGDPTLRCSHLYEDWYFCQ